MMDSAQAQYECVKALAETDFTEDLRTIDLPVMVMHGLDDQICPYEATGARSIKLVKRGTLKTYSGFPHGMPTTNAEVINADLLGSIKA